MPRYLGIDSSTQSCSAIVIDTDRSEVVLDLSVHYGEELPHYDSPNGYLYPEDSVAQHSNPLMWVEGLELLFARGREAGFDWSSVAGVACSGQQHGSVYLNAGYTEATWDPAVPLVDQVRPLLSRATSPIWMDSSTTKQCEEIAEAAGGGERVAAVTGSRPTERFTGPQIRKFFQEDPEGYQQTARIHLVSSFVAFLLAGRDAPIDYGDGAGMNLLDLAQGRWSDVMLEATAPGLGDKLPAVVPSNTRLGRIAPFFVRRYGVNESAEVVVSSGDNPNSLIGMGASHPGTAVVSLGTSDTYFAAMTRMQVDPAGYGHVFGNPAGGFMSLICFKNGSLTREEMAKRFQMSWEDFSAAIRQTPPGNNGNLMLPYLFPEITPRVLKPELKLYGSGAFRSWHDSAAAVRAVVEAQALSMRLHSQWIAERPQTLLVTGGASQNDGILQVFADVFQAALRRLSVTNSAALGAALRAANACSGIDWDALYAEFAAPEPGTIQPDPDTAAVYDRMLVELQRRLAEVA
ncbi:MAG TPA: carbohydrate kinase [Planctomycetes bacterium]|nr:carbohydrate kinase [Planctomycetota bacterium]